MAIYRPVQDNPNPPDTAYLPGGGEPLGRPALAGDHRVDTVIIGGGFVGCSAALHLAEAGKGVILLESNEIGWGSAGRNAGHVAPHATKLEPETVLSVYGPVYGQRLNEMGAKAPQFVLEMAKKHGIDVSPVYGGIATVAHSRGALAKLRKRYEFWKGLGEPVDLLDSAETAELTGSGIYAGCYFDRRGIAINPLAWVRGLARAAIANGASLFEHSKVASIARTGDGWRVTTAGGSVEAEHLLLCTNAYTDDIWPRIKRTIIPVRGYQIWSEPLDEEDRSKILKGVSAMLETRRMPVGIRMHADGRLQFSGGAGLGAEHEPDMAERTATVARMFPQIKPVRVAGWWSGWVTRGIADGWRIHRLAPNLYTAMGCNGRGVAMGPIMGRELSRCVLGEPEQDLLLPITEPAEISGFSFHRPAVTIAMQFMRWKDRAEVKAHEKEAVRGTAA